MSKRYGVSVTKAQKQWMAKKGNVSDWLRTQIAMRIDDFKGYEIIRGSGENSRDKLVFVTVNDRVADKITTKAMQLGMTEKNVVIGLVLQMVSEKMRAENDGSSSEKQMLEQIAQYKARLDEKDKDLIDELDLVYTMIEERSKKKKYLRLIPEIQKLLDVGVSLNDIICTAEAMGEVNGDA